MEQKSKSAAIGCRRGKPPLNEQRGLTLVEIMTVLVILSLLALFAAPEVSNWRPKQRLKGAAEELFSNMHLAKMHAVKNNVTVNFNFTSAAPCPGGSYHFIDVTGVNVTAPITMNVIDPDLKKDTRDLCLSTSAALPVGFTARGLPVASTGGNVTLTSVKVAGVQYMIKQSVAGGISLE